MKISNLSKNNSFSKLVVKALWLKGKTQKDLATELNTSTSSICSMLNGRYKPSAKRLYAISKILNLDMEQLITAMFEE